MEKKKHSKFGLASFVLMIVGLPLVLLAMLFLLVIYNISDAYLFVAGAVPVVSLALGVAGITRNDRKKVFAIIGVALSSAVLIFVVGYVGLFLYKDRQITSMTASFESICDEVQSAQALIDVSFNNAPGAYEQTIEAVARFEDLKRKAERANIDACSRCPEGMKKFEVRQSNDGLWNLYDRKNYDPGYASHSCNFAAPDQLLIGARYLDNQDGTVTDPQTGLMWMRCTLGQSWSKTWNSDFTCRGEARLYQLNRAVQPNANFAGHDDWRLPSVDELYSVVHCSSGQQRPRQYNADGQVIGINGVAQDGSCVEHQSPTIDRLAFPNTPEGRFRTSSSYGNDARYVWYVRFESGAVGWGSSGSSWIRLVREAQLVRCYHKQEEPPSGAPLACDCNIGIFN